MGRQTSTVVGQSPKIDDIELLRKKILETQELLQNLSDQHAKQQKNLPVKKGKMTQTSLHIPTDRKLAFDLYRIQAGLSFKELVINAIEEYMENHAL